MKRRLRLGLLWLVGMSLLAGCTATQQGALVGGTLGAASGAIVGGGAFGEPGVGALVGAGIGAATGALVGEAVENERRAYAAAPPPPPPRVHRGQGPLYATRADPTRGEIINETPWELRIHVDEDGSTSPLILDPWESRSIGLDIGPHRILARAYVQTQFGPRLVGVYDHTIYVDPRSSGWSLRLTRRHF